MIRCLPVLQREAPGIHIIHQTGERDYNDALAAYKSLGESAEVSQVYRGHAGSFCARRFGGVPLGGEHGRGNCGRREAGVFVPFPRAADDHQRVNAEALARHGAAVVVEESKLEGVWLAETIAALLQDPHAPEQMSQAARELAHPNAAKDIADHGGESGGNGRTRHGFSSGDLAEPASRVRERLIRIREHYDPWLR